VATGPVGERAADPRAEAPLTGGTYLALAAIMFLGAAHTGPVLAFQTLWGGPYLYDGFGVDAATAGRFLLTLSLGVSLGYASSGALADRLGLRRVTLLTALAFAAVQFALAAVVPGATPLAWVLPLYALLGFTGGFCVLALSNARALLGVDALRPGHRLRQRRQHRRGLRHAVGDRPGGRGRRRARRLPAGAAGDGRPHAGRRAVPRVGGRAARRPWPST
jgi:MFS family permease